MNFNSISSISNSTKEPLEELYTRNEVATYFKISMSDVDTLITCGLFDTIFFPLGSNTFGVRITKSSIARFINNNLNLADYKMEDFINGIE